MAEDTTADATRRLNVKKQTLDDAYAAPANFLEIDVVNPVTSMGVGKKRYTDYEVRMRVSHGLYYCHIIRLPSCIDAWKWVCGRISAGRWYADTMRLSYYAKFFCLQTNLPVFKVKESSVRRRYSDFEWLRNELERDSKVRYVLLIVNVFGLIIQQYFMIHK